ncbi:DUF6636 domain-containing protein [Nocardia brasiliensis]|uniref:DUF6636 domain-containing protein n=1 Tax=Nocardia brasiliensis TaxID=37326 RepID=UPI001E315498|nr:DUF6636 domain-containing protein [Nocardia brasiliensis]
MKTLVLAFALLAAVGGAAGCTDSSKSSSEGASSAASAVPGVSPQRSPDAAGTPAAPTKLPSREDATVDARDFQQEGYYYFQSPSKNIKCGFIESNGLGTGCQLKNATVIPAELPDCGTRPDRAVAAQVVGGEGKYLCLNQGVFVGPPIDGGSEGGGKVLAYGETIVVKGTACTSSEAGIQCSQAGHGFFIAADKQSLF